MSDLTDFTLMEAALHIRSKVVSPVELTQAYLERIEQLDPQINSFITVTAEQALEQARQAEQALIRRTARLSLVYGLPLALKDLFETRGVRTTAGSRFFANHIPNEDAAVVSRLKAAGMVLLGKLNMHEIALGVTNVNPHYGNVHNPWALDHITGGSSGGSAAALAAGLIPASLGTDSGGSIRIPASLCGVVGLKPTYGRVSLRGVIPLSWNSDHVGPMGRRVVDVDMLLALIEGYDPLDPQSDPNPRLDFGSLATGVAGWRVALADDAFFHEKTDPEVEAVVQAAARQFEALGAQVSRVPFPGAYEAARANSLIVPADAAAFHQQRLREHPDWFGADVLERLQTGASRSAGEYILARRAQKVLRRQFEQFFEQYDILISPTTPIAAPPIAGNDAVEQAGKLTRFTAPFNLTGLPAISVPGGFTATGLPVGVQLVARPWDDARLLQAAYAFEQSTSWHLCQPPLPEPCERFEQGSS